MRRCIVVWIGLLVYSLGIGQVYQPIHWHGESRGDSVFLTAEMDEGWHMTLIEMGDKQVGKDYYTTYHFATSEEEWRQTSMLVRYCACNEQMCTAPTVWRFWCDSRNARDDYELGDVSAYQVKTTTDRSLWMIFLLGLLGGFLAIFTPCVWPIIPMTVSFFIRKSSSAYLNEYFEQQVSQERQRKQYIHDAVLFGCSIVIIYVVLGLLLTVLFGASTLNSLATNSFINVFFFVLLVIFSLSFFGLFEIRLPSSWATLMDAKARSTSGFVSILLMACTLVLVSFSCTGPIIGTLLVEAAGKSILAPAIGMLGFSIALALPFSLFALFPDWMRNVPKSGGWMQTLKVSLAFIELALSLKFLSVADAAYGWGILSEQMFYAIWIACFMGMGIYLIWRMKKSIVHVSDPKDRRIRMGIAGISAALSIGFAVYLLPGLWGKTMTAVAAFAPIDKTMERMDMPDYQEGLALARRSGRPILMEFTGYGCVNCRKMEAVVLQDPEVRDRMSHYVFVMLYVDSRKDMNEDGWEDGYQYSKLQMERFNTNAQPFFIQLSSTGQVISDPFGYTTDKEEFLRWLKY